MLTVPNDYAAALGLGENRKLDNLLRFDDFIKEENKKVKSAKDGYIKLREDYIHSFIDDHCLEFFSLIIYIFISQFID